MSEQSPHKAGSAGSVGSGLCEPTNEDGLQVDLSWKVRGRLLAVLRELDELPDDWDVRPNTAGRCLESIPSRAASLEGPGAHGRASSRPPRLGSPVYGNRSRERREGT